MKKFHFLILICVVLCAVSAFVLTGCNSNALTAPYGLKLDGPTMTLSWKAVDDASYYIVNISGNGVNDNKNTRRNSLSLANLGLSAGDYQLKVKACANGKEQTDSAWSKTVSFSQDADSGLTFKFIKNNTEVEVTGLGRAEGTVVIPDTYRGAPVTKIGERAFSGKSKLTGIVMSDNIVSIGASAFYNCTFLESATLSKNLTSIGEKAFQSCRLLEGVLKIPQKVTEIGENAFAYCTSLTGVEFNDKLETIGTNAFAYCSELKTLNIPDSVVSIGDSAFFSCKNVTSVQFGKGLELIGEYAFASCEGIENVNLNKGLKEIGPYAFGRCFGLKTVICSDTIEKIGEGAFFEDAKLESVALGTGIKRIDKGAFKSTAIWNNSPNEVYLCNWFLGCKDNKIATINIENGTVGIANYALAEYESLSRVELPASVKIIGNCAFAGSKVTAVVIGSGVEEIGTQAFYKCDMLSTVILGAYDFRTGKMTDSSLKIINEYAFMGCSQLYSIEIPSSVEVISSYAFNDSAMYKNAGNGVVYAGNWVVGCNSQRATGTIVIEAGTVGIANYAFYKCSMISSVQIPDSVKTIGRSAFYQCTGLETVSLPSDLEVIEDYTFYGCSKLSLPVLPQTLKTIGRSAFYKCALSNTTGEDTDNDVLTIPDSVETIGDYAFFGCGYTSYDLENFSVLQCGIDVVVLGNGVKHIGTSAFNTIASLKRVVFGNSVQTVGDKAFYQCASLTDVAFNNGLQHIGARAFYGCNKLTSITLPDGLTVVGDYAFYRCAGLKEVNFGANVQRIGDYAFYGCSVLTKLNLPASVTSIGKQAFRSCIALQSVVLNSGVADIDEHAFYGCKALTIYAENSAVQDGWDSKFNSAYRPVIWGCTIRDGYVYAVTKGANTVSYLNSTNSLSAPQREGYRFAGWSTVEGSSTAEYAAGDLVDVMNGTRLYTVWIVDNSEI